MGVFVVGMHRSGTSATVRVLESIGFFAGDESDFYPPPVNDPTGYRELIGAQDANEAALRAVGRAWDQPVGIDWDRLNPVSRAEVESMIGATIDRLDQHRPWVIKDPRLCLTLPLWSAAEQPIAVLTHRNPLAVARSLQARDGRSLAEGIALWEWYQRSALRNTADMRRVFVSFDALFDDPEAFGGRLLELLHRVAPTLVFAGATPRPAPIEAALRRQDGSTDELDEWLNPPQRRLFQVMEDAATAGLPTEELVERLAAIASQPMSSDSTAQLSAADATIDPAGLAVVDQDDESVLDAAEIAFVICIEANRLEPQALLLCESIRRYAGRYRNAAIFAIAPRPELWLSSTTRDHLDRLGVTYLALDLNRTGSTYGPINRVVVAAWAEANLGFSYLAMLDTDMVFVGPPRLHRADVGVRPVDVKGSATAGADDPNDRYWGELANIAGIDLDDLPLLTTSVDTATIRASYNGGFSVVRRDLGIYGRGSRILFESLERRLQPSDTATIIASTGDVGAEAARLWGSNQAALSLAIWSTTHDVTVYDHRYNVPLHIVTDPAVVWADGAPVLVHYRYLAELHHGVLLPTTLARLGVGEQTIAWIDEQRRALFGYARPGVGWCTMAIGQPYRDLARTLIGDAPTLPWTVLTDEPAAFTDLAVHTRAHQPTGPMAEDYRDRIRQTGPGLGACAYHDKRFALIEALVNHRTAVFVDADSRFARPPVAIDYPMGISVLPTVNASIRQHLAEVGPWRLEHFVALAEHLTGSAAILDEARWCQESCIAITADGSEATFFRIWEECADFMQAREVFSGEGGVIGLAAAIVGWTVDFSAVGEAAAALHHEGGGPKSLPAR